mgnify:CR=1 FL=1
MAKIKEQLKKEIYDCRFHADLMSLKVKELRIYDTSLNVVLAIASSGSIASWTIWDEYAIYWGGLIALSQLITALKPIFPFHKHVHTLNHRCYKQEILFLELIEMWQDLNDKSENESTIKTRLSYLIKQINENEFFDDDDGFEFSKRMQDKAQSMTEDILVTKYNIL